jgi:hypothetical protein
MYRNLLETSRSIMEVPREFQNPKPNSSSTYQKPSRMSKTGSCFHWSLIVDSMSKSVEEILRSREMEAYCR